MRLTVSGLPCVLTNSLICGVQHAEYDSVPKSVKGTIAYLAPEVVLAQVRFFAQNCQSLMLVRQRLTA